MAGDTYAAITTPARRIALALPNVEDGLSNDAPALFANGKLFIRLRDDLDAIVVKTTSRDRHACLAAEPDVCFMTDHYQNYEWIHSFGSAPSASRTYGDCFSRLTSRSNRA